MAEGIAQAFIRLFIVGVFLVDLGDIEEGGQLLLLYCLPCLFGADGAAVFSRNDNDNRRPATLMAWATSPSKSKYPGVSQDIYNVALKFDGRYRKLY